MENRSRNDNKNFWSNSYLNWSNEEFKERLRISRESFGFILHRIKTFIEKITTKMVPTPIESHRQLALTIYRMTHNVRLKF